MTSGKRKNNSNHQDTKAITQEEIESFLENPEKLEQLDKEQLMLVVQEATTFSGPIPPPGILKAYESAFPGAADRIIKMAEEQSKHRQYIEKKEVDTESRDSLLGILSALAIGGAIIVCGTRIVMNVPNISGAIAGTLLNLVGIATIIGTFLKGTGNSWKTK